MRYTLSLVALLCDIGAISPVYAACPTNDSCSFLYSGGTYTELTPQGSSSVASGINDKGQIVGFSNNGHDIINGFLYSRGAYHTLNYRAAPLLGYTE
jgi:probable HAF family extracellular repeat protein